jgi:hypothetical protein
LSYQLERLCWRTAREAGLPLLEAPEQRAVMQRSAAVPVLTDPAVMYSSMPVELVETQLEAVWTSPPVSLRVFPLLAVR